MNKNNKSNILNSRRAKVAIAWSVLLVINFFFEIIPNEYTVLVAEASTIIATALIAGYSLEDLALAIFNNKSPEQIFEEIKEVANEFDNLDN